ncbi:MAG: NADAR domain-containing protein [Bacteroidales bacterium]|nr:NADAR domain-containing protein [Bacteroidales bacterium]
MITDLQKKEFEGIELGREEVYDPSIQRILPFKLVGDPIDDIDWRFSNMASGFPFEFEGRTWKNSEELYLCGEFSEPGERSEFIQRDIISATSGYAAKRFKKAKYKVEVRKDFAEFRLQWMLFVVWQKCRGSQDFRYHLLQSVDYDILVENTTTDNQGTAEIWGCRNPELTKVRKDCANAIKANPGNRTKAELKRYILVETNKIRNRGEWRGQNNIGKILMICRKALLLGIEPPIDYEFLAQYDIHILGKKIDFAKCKAEANNIVGIMDPEVVAVLNLMTHKMSTDKEFHDKVVSLGMPWDTDHTLEHLARYVVASGGKVDRQEYVATADLWLARACLFNQLDDLDHEDRKAILHQLFTVDELSMKANDELLQAALSKDWKHWITISKERDSQLQILNQMIDQFLDVQKDWHPLLWRVVGGVNQRARESNDAYDLRQTRKLVLHRLIEHYTSDTK